MCSMTCTIGLLVLHPTNILMQHTIMALTPLVTFIHCLLITGVMDKTMWGIIVRMTTSKILHGTSVYSACKANFFVAIAGSKDQN